jgi:hypothetical protein
MNLKEFINKYDFEGSIVLLEGKRKVLADDEHKLIALGTKLASNTKFIIFRSGNASGADEFFTKGVAAVDARRIQVITPYTGHRKKTNLAYESIGLDQIDLAQEPEIIFQSKGNKKRDNLIDEYVKGNKNSLSTKAAYLIRDTVKVVGTKEIPAASFAIFYDDLTSPMQGGTGHTMEVCKRMGVEMVDQRVWERWV